MMQRKKIGVVGGLLLGVCLAALLFAQHASLVGSANGTPVIPHQSPIPTWAGGTITPPPTLPTDAPFPPNLPGIPPGPPATPNPNGAPTVGWPAITPRTPSNDPATPTFTAQDASAYVAARPLVATKADSTGPISVTQVAFVTVAQAKTMFNLPLYLAPDRLLCVVAIGGDFKINGPNVAIVGHHGYEYFDAHTGNYLGVAIEEY